MNNDNSSKNNLTSLNLFVLWLGAAISIAEIMTGTIIAHLGFKTGIGAILLGHLIGVGLLVLGGIIGTEKRIPSIMSTRISFGLFGTYIFSILNVLQLIGWTAIMIISAGRSVNMVSRTLWSFDNITFWSVLIGMLVCLWIYAGDKGFKTLNTVAVSLLFILTVVLCFIIFKNGDLFIKKAAGDMTFGAAVELNVIMPLSWLPLIADYTRFAKDKKGAAIGSFAGYFLGSCWMYTIGLCAGILYGGNADLGAIMAAANLGFAALGIIILSTVTTTFLDAYSAGVTFLNIMPKLNEKNVSVIMGLIGTAIAVVMPIEQYENFLYAIGSVFAPLFAILFTDYFIIKNKTSIQEDLLVDCRSLISWALGVFAYYQIIKFDFILGSTLPAMVVTSLIYIIIERCMQKWTYVKKSPSSCQM